ncbi:MAG: alpha/beta fold hydrolase [Longimicrobiales bacterium]|nr:alpha/beta fold hydrolase [Longimicrobiales bacterium]
MNAPGLLSMALHVPEVGAGTLPVAVLLHGRGAHRWDLQGLRPALPPGTALLTPEAPHPAAPWGYGPGWAWYRYVAADRVVPETLAHSLAELDRLLDALPALLPARPGPVVLGGFSQGGTTALAYALSRPGGVAGVLNFSGFLVDDESVPLPVAGAPNAAPVFWGHGVHDAAISFALADRGRARLAAAGIPLETHDYPIGHGIAPQEVDDARRWLARVLAGP